MTIVAQWDVYLNPVPRAREVLPYLVVLQSDLLQDLPTRLVVPLSRSLAPVGALPKRLAPVFDVLGERLVLKPHETGTLPERLLRHPVQSLRREAHQLIDAMDAVISGI